MASGIYTQLAGDLADDSVNLDTDVIKVCLLNASHSFNAGHTTYADVSANEITGTNYVAGGATLSGQTIISDVWDATDQSWASATFTAYHAVLYDVTNGNSLICSFISGRGTRYSQAWSTARYFEKLEARNSARALRFGFLESFKCRYPSRSSLMILATLGPS